MFQSHIQLYSIYMDIQLDSLKQKRFCCILFRYIVFRSIYEILEL